MHGVYRSFTLFVTSALTARASWHGPCMRAAAGSPAHRLAGWQGHAALAWSVRPHDRRPKADGRAGTRGGRAVGLTGHQHAHDPAPPIPTLVHANNCYDAHEPRAQSP